MSGQTDCRIMVKLEANALCYPWEANEETRSEGKQTVRSCTTTPCHKPCFCLLQWRAVRSFCTFFTNWNAYKHLNNTKQIELCNSLKWVTAHWWQMNAYTCNPPSSSFLLCQMTEHSQGQTLSDGWYIESCRNNWDSFQGDGSASGTDQYLKSLSAEQTNLDRTLARNTNKWHSTMTLSIQTCIFKASFEISK